MKNLGSKIAEHKNKVLRGKENSNEGGCNCQNAPCPVNGNYLAKSVMYTGKLESDNPNQLVQVPVVHGYFGSARGTFKDGMGDTNTTLNIGSQSTQRCQPNTGNYWMMA